MSTHLYPWWIHPEFTRELSNCSAIYFWRLVQHYWRSLEAITSTISLCLVSTFFHINKIRLRFSAYCLVYFLVAKSMSSFAIDFVVCNCAHYLFKLMTIFLKQYPTNSSFGTLLTTYMSTIQEAGYKTPNNFF